MREIRFVLLVLCASVLFACGGKEFRETDTDEATYNEAMEELTADREGFPWILNGTDYEKIFRLLKEVQLRYPYSPYATLAELRTADAYFKKEEYVQAAIEYEAFISQHPSHQEVPYATYRSGLSYYKQMKSPDRDPTSTRQAIAWFGLFMENYPNSELVDEAAKLKAKARRQLAEREIYIGKFYAKRDNHKAAAERFKMVVDEYEDTRQLEEALFLLGKSYAEMDETELAKEALGRVVEEFPGDEYSDDAAELLEEIKGREGKKAKRE